jgi:RNA polymerase sigma-70 factor, ECF subfamily
MSVSPLTGEAGTRWVSSQPQRVPPALEATVDLLQRARGGDQAAWDTFAGRYIRELRRFAHGRLPGPARGMTDTDDLVQDAVVNTVRQLDRFEFRRSGALLAYLRQAVQNRIVDEARRAARRAVAFDSDEDCVDRGPSPLQQAICRQNAERYRMALRRLRPRDRLALALRLDGQATYAEMAARLGMPSENAARVAVKRALVRLARVISEESHSD